MAAVVPDPARPSAGRLPATDTGAPRAVACWLLACCALVFAMIVVGGVTRLTHSGLSITEWQPIVGTLPPLSAQDWEAAFAKYQATPEYRQVNKGMALDEFKGIFWWEYFHRLLGRLIGVAFLVPFLWFLARRAIPEGYGWTLAGIFALGGLQGALGWYMVKSGLVDDPRVSQFRLTAHLSLAFVIFAAMFWVALSLLDPRRMRAGCARAARAAAAYAFAAARVRDGRDRRLRRRHSCRVRVQHVSVDERARGAARDPDARAVVEELLLQHGDRAVRPSPRRVDARVRGARPRGGSCAGRRRRRRARTSARTSCSRCSPCRSRSAS